MRTPRSSLFLFLSPLLTAEAFQVMQPSRAATTKTTVEVSTDPNLTATAKKKKNKDILKQIGEQSRKRQGKPVVEEEEVVATVAETTTTSAHGVPYEAWYAKMAGAEVPPLEIDEGPKKLATEGDWSAFLDEEGSGAVYYFNQITGQSQWEVPTTSFPKVELSEATETGARKTKRKSLEQMQLEAGLPRPLASQGYWTAYFDAKVTNMVYYYNVETGKSQWEKPTDTFPNVHLTTSMRKRILGTQAKKLRTGKPDEKVVVVEDFVTQLLRGFQELVNPRAVRLQDKLLYGTETSDRKPLNLLDFLQGFLSFFLKKDDSKKTTFHFPNLFEMFAAKNEDDLKSKRN